MNVKNRIIEQALSLFKRYGVRGVTMDDIARHLAISKKTIYQYFSDKNQIVIECVLCNSEEHENQICKIDAQTEDTIERMFKISEHIRTLLRSVNPALLYDLQKYHPKAWQLHQQHMFEHNKKHLMEIMEKGVKEGYFREELDLEALATMRIHQIAMGFNPEIFPIQQYDIPQLQLQFFEHFLYGICTQKGFEKIQSYKNSQLVQSSPK